MGLGHNMADYVCYINFGWPFAVLVLNDLTTKGFDHEDFIEYFC